jgi:LPPG:FO 2-phospho-L-lactate transferase
MHFEGASEAVPAPGVLEAIAEAEAIVLCPSNPFISIGPILAIPGIRDALRRRRDKVAAISPIVGGRALKGPAAKMMKSLKMTPSAFEVARLYRDFVGVFVLDEVDRKQAVKVQALGMRAVVTNTIMSDLGGRKALASAVIHEL